MPLPYPYTHVGGFAVTVSTLYTGSRILMIEIFDPVKSPLVMSERGATRLGSSLPFFLAYAEAQRRHGLRARCSPIWCRCPRAAHPSRRSSSTR